MKDLPKFLERKGFGMRTIKTMIAVSVCYLLTTYVFECSPYFACIAAVFSMQNDLDNSIQASIFKIAATTIGGFVGAGIYYIDLHWFNEIGLSFITIAIGTGLVIYLMNKSKKSSSIPTASVVFFATMLTASGNIVMYAVSRILQTILGICVALIINKLVHPPKEEYRPDARN